MTDSMVCGGVEKSLLSLLAALEGWEIDLLLTWQTGSLLPLVPAAVRVREVPLLPGARYEWRHGRRRAMAAALISGRWGDALRLLWRRGIRMRLLVPPAQRRLRTFLELVDMRQWDASRTYDLAVAYGDTPEILGFVAERVPAHRKMAWIHNDFPVAHFDRAGLAKVYRTYDEVGACSQELAAQMTARLRPWGVPVRYFPYFLDAALFDRLAQAYDPFPAAAAGLRVVSIGRICEQKGYDLALEACRLLQAQGVDTEWTLVGDGPDAPALRQRSAQLGLADRFRLVGLRTNPYPFIKQCDIYVQPSRYEGYCLTLAEARLLCRPIVTTAFTGAREQIRDGETGLLVDATPAAIAAGVARLAREPALRAALAENLQREKAVNRDLAALRRLVEAGTGKGDEGR